MIRQQEFKKDDVIEFDEDLQKTYLFSMPYLIERYGKGPFTVAKVIAANKESADHSQLVTIQLGEEEATLSGAWFKLAA